jgi:hypothetical protein
MGHGFSSAEFLEPILDEKVDWLLQSDRERELRKKEL